MKIELDDVKLVRGAVGGSTEEVQKTILIWDLDFFFGDQKKYVPNTNVMKLSSYYKQLKYVVKLVKKEGDEKTPFDQCYLFKEDIKTPNPPINWLLCNEDKIKWAGEAVKWREDPDLFNSVVLSCRPDYLLYGLTETPEQRADVIRLFDNNGKLLKQIQNYENVYKAKRTIIADLTSMWNATTEDLVTALNSIKGKKNLSFENPVNIERIIKDKRVQDAFLQLKLNSRTQLSYDPVSWDLYNEVIDFCKRLVEEKPSFGIPTPVFIYSKNAFMHKDNTEAAQKDWEALVQAVLDTRKRGIHIKIMPPKYIQDTPYFFIFSCIAAWTNSAYWRRSWLEYISLIYGGKIGWEAQKYWNTPSKRHPVFRDLLRQTYQNQELLLGEFKGKNSTAQVPWELWKEVFKFNI